MDRKCAQADYSQFFCIRTHLFAHPHHWGPVILFQTTFSIIFKKFHQFLHPKCLPDRRRTDILYQFWFLAFANILYASINVYFVITTSSSHYNRTLIPIHRQGRRHQTISIQESQKTLNSSARCLPVKSFVLGLLPCGDAGCGQLPVSHLSTSRR